MLRKEEMETKRTHGKETTGEVKKSMEAIYLKHTLKNAIMTSNTLCTNLKTFKNLIFC